MTTIMPESESLKRAVKWISEHLKEKSDQSVNTLINEAVLRFDLNPKQSQSLYELYRNK